MSANIIEFGQHRSASKTPPYLTPDHLYLAAHFAAPAYMALPFITMKPRSERTGGYPDASSCWNDVSTDDRHVDYTRGKAFALQAVDALRSDHALGGWPRTGSRGLELTFEHIFEGAVRRREKGGRYSRSLTSSESGFLNEIARILSEGVQS